MKQMWSALCAAALVAATVGVGAQAGAPGQEKPGAPGAGAPAQERGAPPQDRPQAGAPSTVTITGCIQSAPPTAAAAEPAGAKSSAKFILANAKSASGGGAVGTAGSAAPIASRYQLEGSEKDLSAQVDRQVEITGTVASSPGGAAPGGAPMLKVTAVKMVSATCDK